MNDRVIIYAQEVPTKVEKLIIVVLPMTQPSRTRK